MRTKACIYKRGATWSVKMPQPAGRFKWRVTGARKKDAEAVRDEFNRRAAMGAAYTAPPETWKQFTTGWRERYAQRVRPSTLEQAKTALGHLDQFDDRLIEAVTRAELEDAVSVIAKRTPRTAQIVLRIAKQVLSDAKSRGQVVDERIFDIPPPRHRERDPRFPTWADAETLAEWMPESIARMSPSRSRLACAKVNCCG